MSKITGFMLTSVLCLVGIVLKGYILSTAWGWFIAPLVGLNLGLWEACAIGILVNSMTKNSFIETKFDNCVTYSDVIALLVKDGIIHSLMVFGALYVFYLIIIS